MERALLIVSISIALTSAVRAGYISRDLRLRLADGPTTEALRELSVELWRVDAARAEGLRLLGSELEMAGPWQPLTDRAPEHALEVWASTAELLRR